MFVCAEAALRRPQATAGKAAALNTAQQANGQSSSKHAADRLAKALVTTARSAAKQGSSAKAPAASSAPATAAAAAPAPTDTAAAEALKQAAASGKLGCPKCRGATFGCKKCRAAYVKSTGIAIAIDRSLHADIFSTVQQAAGFDKAAIGSIRQEPGMSQKPSGPQAATAPSAQAQAEGSKFSNKPQSSSKGRGTVEQSSVKGQQTAATRQMPLCSGQMHPANGQTRSVDRIRSAKRNALATTAQGPALKKRKSASEPSAAGTAGTPATAPTNFKRVQAAISPAPVAAAAKRRRLSQEPTATAADPRAVKKPSASAADAKAVKKTSVTASVSGSKADNSGKAAVHSNKPSSSSKKAVALAVVRDRGAAKKASPRDPSPAPPKQAAAKTPVAPASKPTQSAKPKSSPAKSATAPKITSTAKIRQSSSTLAAAPAKSKCKSVALPKVKSAAKIKQTPSARAAAAVGSALVQGMESKLGCSKCRFVASGCKRCRAKQAGRLSLGTNIAS